MSIVIKSYDLIYDIPKKILKLIDDMVQMAIPGDDRISSLVRKIVKTYGAVVTSILMYYTRKSAKNIFESQWDKYRYTVQQTSVELFTSTMAQIVKTMKDVDYDMFSCMFVTPDDLSEVSDLLSDKIDEYIEKTHRDINKYLIENASSSDELRKFIENQQLSQISELHNYGQMIKSSLKKHLLSKSNSQILSLPAPNPCENSNQVDCDKAKSMLSEYFHQISQTTTNILDQMNINPITTSRNICTTNLKSFGQQSILPLKFAGEKFKISARTFAEETQLKIESNTENIRHIYSHFYFFLIVLVFAQVLNFIFRRGRRTNNRRLEDNGRYLTYNFVHKKSMKNRLNKLNKKQIETLCKKMKKQIKNTKSDMIKSLLQPLY